MKNEIIAVALLSLASVAYADQVPCNLAEYKATPGLMAAAAGDTLTLTWDGDRNQELRLQLSVNAGTPIIRDLSIRRKGVSQWATLAGNVTPEFRVVSGMRRATDQQIQPLRRLGIDITSEVIDDIKWEAFWDAPLNVPGGEPAHGNSTPPLGGIAHQPGLPRRPDEVKRAEAAYHVKSCSVKTNGGRIEVTFPGVELGVFSGRLEYHIYKGSNLIRQAIVAKTEEPSVAYKYDAGLKGLSVQPTSRMVWRDITNLWQDYRFGVANHENPVPLRAANRLVVAETPAGSIAAFPPPHRFFWVREVETNLGYNWYRKDNASSFSFGIRQAEREDIPSEMGRGPEDTSQNFALYSARPGTWQQMPVFFYVSADAAQPTFESALAFTRQDRYKPLPVTRSWLSTFTQARYRGCGQRAAST